MRIHINVLMLRVVCVYKSGFAFFFPVENVAVNLGG